MPRQKGGVFHTSFTSSHREVRGERGEACETESKDLDDRAIKGAPFTSSSYPRLGRALTMPEEYDGPPGSCTWRRRGRQVVRRRRIQLPPPRPMTRRRSSEEEGRMRLFRMKSCQGCGGVVVSSSQDRRTTTIKKDTTLGRDQRNSRAWMRKLKLLLRRGRTRRSRGIEGLHRGSPVKQESPKRFRATKPKERTDVEKEEVGREHLRSPTQIQDI